MRGLLRVPVIVRIWRRYFEPARQAKIRRIRERREYNLRSREYQMKASALPPGEPWRYFIGDYPYGYHRVEANRREWGESKVISPGDMPPCMNIAGLYWRPVATESVSPN